MRQQNKSPSLAMNLATAALYLALSTTISLAQETEAIVPQSPADIEEIQKYCSNITDNAADARYAIQAKELSELRAQVDQRVKALEEKRKEYEVWLQRRNEFIGKAQDSLVDIISKMKPDAAAAQMALIGDEAAAALLLKLKPRTSSVILNEMPPEKSAQLARVIVGAQSVGQSGRKARAAGQIQ
ncbi:MotE family protein [Phyllobacterium phragmitis]|uniref:MotE family protein n=1 Tax=Phyllobacterium phragmitis TaxID=2670329 RepID=UPI00315B0740